VEGEEEELPWPALDLGFGRVFFDGGNGGLFGFMCFIP
jgi:hypothetical protein